MGFRPSYYDPAENGGKGMPPDTDTTSVEVRMRHLVQQCGFEIVEEAKLAGRPAKYSPVPPQLNQVIVRLLSRLHPEGLYEHQSRAIEVVLNGQDVCLATPTASGKSLVFMAVSAHMLKSDPSARVLAFYPAKALIQDQLNKWKSLLEQLGMQSGYIDGGVPIESRLGILKRHRIVLMTPDVAHAWLMSKLQKRERNVSTILRHRVRRISEDCLAGIVV